MTYRKARYVGPRTVDGNMLSLEQWLDKCRALDAAMWDRAERTCAVRAYQMGHESPSQADVQQEYEKIKKLHGGHGTYDAYRSRALTD